MGVHVDLVGRRFGMLTVIRYLGASRWECLCECGGASTPVTGALTSGNSKSCGCRKRNALGESTTKHGRAGTKLHRIWKGMKSRCYNPNSPRYADYGGRGITVCDRWRESFENFYADMGDPPPGATLDRKDNGKGYSPSNCRWSTRAEQNLNKRNTVYVNGVPLKTLAKQRGVSYSTLYYRLTHGLEV